MRDGNTCITAPYQERRALVESITTSKTIKPAVSIPATTPKDIIEIYSKKVKKETCEGLVLKQPSLPYILGDKTHWIKLKKFEPLDLVVIGLLNGSEKQKTEQHNTPFTQAIIAPYDPTTNTYPALGVINLVRENPATGRLFAHDVYEFIRDQQTTHPGKNVTFGKRLPNVYIAPENSIVLEVRAMNLDAGTPKDFACKLDTVAYTLRIGYVKSIREDKKSEQATTIKCVARIHTIQR